MLMEVSVHKDKTGLSGVPTFCIKRTADAATLA